MSSQVVSTHTTVIGSTYAVIVVIASITPLLSYVWWPHLHHLLPTISKIVFIMQSVDLIIVLPVTLLFM